LKGKIVLLGTSSAMPTPERNNSGVYLLYMGRGLLFDCGEGTQRQIMKAGLSVYRTGDIFISHLHTDHILGLPGLIETLDMHDKPQVNIYSVNGLSELLDCVLKGMIYAPDIRINIKEYGHSDNLFVVMEEERFTVRSIGLNHVVECLGYSFEEKPVRKFIREKIKELSLSDADFIRLKKEGYIKKYGRVYTIEQLTTEKRGFKFTYIPDTYKTENIVKLAYGSDVLVIESTYLDEEEKAKQYGHLTLEYILEIYPRLNVKKIILTHFSRRYRDTGVFEERIKQAGVKNIITGRDFLTIEF